MAEHTSTLDNSQEQWRPVVGWEEWYAVSNVGRVRREGRAMRARIGHILKWIPTHKGYFRVKLSRNDKGRFISVHKLVADAFLGPCPIGKEVNHKDCDKSNNAASNLEYMTPSENKCHATRAGLHGMSKLSIDDVQEIRRLLEAGMTQTAIGRQFGVGQYQISRIHHGKRWAHLPSL